jgi:hypothetical protein
MSNAQREIESAHVVSHRHASGVRASKGRSGWHFVVRFEGESDVHWRAVNAQNPDEARAQALMLSHGDRVDYAAVDRESRSIAVLGTIGGA